jgi:hypothetical protein
VCSFRSDLPDAWCRWTLTPPDAIPPAGERQATATNRAATCACSRAGVAFDAAVPIGLNPQAIVAFW